MEYADFVNGYKSSIYGIAGRNGVDAGDVPGEAWLAWWEARHTYGSGRGLTAAEWALDKFGRRCRRWQASRRFGVELDGENGFDLADINDPLAVLVDEEGERERASIVNAWVARHAGVGGTVRAVILGALAGLDTTEIAARVRVTPRRVNQILAGLSRSVGDGPRSHARAPSSARTRRARRQLTSTPRWIQADLFAGEAVP